MQPFALGPAAGLKQAAHIVTEKTQIIDAEELAQMLTERSAGLSREEFEALLDSVLAEPCSSTVAAIAVHMPDEITGLLPRKYLH
jgi:hypothetical protein